MNIKEHIEAGHYPKDDKGRTVVPLRGGGSATIIATDAPLSFIPDGQPRPLFGWGHPTLDGGAYSAEAWMADGHIFPNGDHAGDLMPPPPQKVTRWAALTQDQIDGLSMYASDGPARRELTGDKMLVEITYEVPWS